MPSRKVLEPKGPELRDDIELILSNQAMILRGLASLQPFGDSAAVMRDGAERIDVRLRSK